MKTIIPFSLDHISHLPKCILSGVGICVIVVALSGLLKLSVTPTEQALAPVYRLFSPVAALLAQLAERCLS